MKGKHDDLIMAIAMAIYVGENSFSQLNKANDMTKAMLNSWVNTEDVAEETPVHLRGRPNTDVLNPRIKPHAGSEQLYREYSWLFGASKKR